MEQTKKTEAAPGIPLDIRNRQEFIDQLIALLDTISEARASLTFALNGKWGVGKSFVLDMLRRKLQTDSYDSKYMVFHYNCWQYDFYDEPLIAILTAMLDCTDAELHVLPQDARAFAEQSLAALKPKLVSAAGQFIRSRYGLDLTELLSLLGVIQDVRQDADRAVAEQRAFDPNQSLHKTIHQAREALQTLSADRTLVIIVDELDRCLPDYAIKVLERLHHLFYMLPNTAVTLSIDKGQLNQSIRQIFGGDNADEYLRKLISFEVTLDPGLVMEKFPLKYADYFNLFDADILKTMFPDDPSIFRHGFQCERFFSALLTDIPGRELDQLINRCMTIHKLLFPEEQKDYSFLCLEILWVVLTEIHGYTSMPLVFDEYSAHREKKGFWIDPAKETGKAFADAFNDYLAQHWDRVNVHYIREVDLRHRFRFGQPVGIPELLIWYLARLFDSRTQDFEMPEFKPGTPNVEKLRALRDKNLLDMKKFIRYLKIIK